MNPVHACKRWILRREKVELFVSFNGYECTVLQWVPVRWGTLLWICVFFLSKMAKGGPQRSLRMTPFKSFYRIEEMALLGGRILDHS